MIDVSQFKPKTVYVLYIAATPERMFEALTSPDFTRRYFGGLAIEAEPRTGGAFVFCAPDGSIHIKGRVVEWSPPRRFACTWTVVGMPAARHLPECLVAYEIEPAGGCVRLTLTEAHQWDIPDAILSGGRVGWPAILSGLKTLLETGKPLAVEMAPPAEMMEALEAMKR